MDPLPIPDWIRRLPEVAAVSDFHLPDGSGISGPPAGAFLVDTPAENALRPIPMWHLLFGVTDDDLDRLDRSRVLNLAVSVVPIFQLHPWHATIDGRLIDPT